ncbi:MAG: pyridoxamine 5'-phosphate oxidase family protein [Candidatus Parcubacteria bacterium]|nr:pyridoxamine 5'-phosphate oxidase family protein [Candidatus Parcubacteria bacterium]
MITSKIKKIIENNPIALATCAKNKPHVIAVANVKVIGKDTVVITDNLMKTCKNNILKNHNIALAVWDKKWDGYRLKGEAEYFDKGKWLDFVKKMKENKGYLAKGAILIKINEVVKLG